MAERFRCSATSLEAAEPLYATASTVRRWILVEQPGAWGRDAVRSSRMPSAVGRELDRVARRLHARLLLIRRHARTRTSPRTCMVAVTTPGTSWLERTVVDDVADLLDVDWAPLREDAPVLGVPEPGPVFLVCTNGKHDVCCAELGRPLAHALDAAFGEQVWESSHFGGDRFAGNLVCLPDGLYFGRLRPADGLAVAHAYAAGGIVLDHYRGRSSFPVPVQAAEFFFRERAGVAAVGDLALVGWEATGGVATVRFRSTACGPVRVVVEEFEAPQVQRLTCAGVEAHPPRFRVVEIDCRDDGNVAG